MVADELDYVVGVDSHRDEHVLAVVTRARGRGDRTERRSLRTGLAIGQRSVWPRGTRPAGAAGRSRAAEATAPVLRALLPAAARRCSSFPARRDPSGGCTATTTCSTRSQRRGRRSRARHSRCRARERREALRLRLIARRSALDVRREAPTQLRAVIVTAPRPSFATSCGHRRQAGCSTAAAASAARPAQAPTSSPHDSSWAASPARSKPQPAKPASPNARSSPTHARSHRNRPTSPASARSSPPNSSSPGHTPAGSAPKPASPASPASRRPPPPAAKPHTTASAAAATDNPTAPSTRSSSTAASTTNRPATTPPDPTPNERAADKQHAHPSATPPATSTHYSNTSPPRLDRSQEHHSGTGTGDVVVRSGCGSWRG